MDVVCLKETYIKTHSNILWTFLYLREKTRIENINDTNIECYTCLVILAYIYNECYEDREVS
jgi:hypothetical protein